MTFQTSEPLHHRNLQPSARAASDLIHFFHDGDVTVDAPYQRGAVWTTEQRMLLIKSLLLGIPVPAIIINRREDAPVGEPFYAVIDGKQRMLALSAWFKSELAVPASWFPAEYVESAVDTDDGPYVFRAGLSPVADRMFRNRAILPVAETAVDTVQEEAAIYLLVNGAGTSQTDDDMANAAHVANSTT